MYFGLELGLDINNHLLSFKFSKTDISSRTRAV